MYSVKLLLCLAFLALASQTALAVPVETVAKSQDVETTTQIIFERQEEGEGTEITTGVRGPDAVIGEEDTSDEASSETVTEAVVAAVVEEAVTLPPRGVPLKTTFGQEWSIVTGNEIQADETVVVEDNVVDVKAPTKFVDEKTTTFEQQWAAVNGNESALTVKPVVTSTAAPTIPSTTLRTFQDEWKVVVGIKEEVQEQEVAKTEAPVEAVTDNSSPEDDEEDDEDATETSVKVPAVAPAASTKAPPKKKPLVTGGFKDTTFDKEWAIVTGEVLADERAGGKAQARAACGGIFC